MMLRLLKRGKAEGLNAMLVAPVVVDPRLRGFASRVRTYLYARTSYGQIIDITQAFFSGVSCIFYIAVAYMPSEPVWVSDVEDFFTCYFGIDFAVRLWLAQDSLAFYFSLVSLLDFSENIGQVV